MKKPIYFLTGVLFIFMVACEEAATIDEPVDCIEVKLIYELCNQAVIQLVSPNTSQLELGTFEVDGITYENVFKTFFHCEQLDQALTDSASFRIRPINEDDWDALFSQECIYCEPHIAGHLPFTYVEILENCNVALEQ